MAARQVKDVSAVATESGVTYTRQTEWRGRRRQLPQRRPQRRAWRPPRWRRPGNTWGSNKEGQKWHWEINW